MSFGLAMSVFEKCLRNEERKFLVDVESCNRDREAYKTNIAYRANFFYEINLSYKTNLAYRTNLFL